MGRTPETGTLNQVPSIRHKNEQYQQMLDLPKLLCYVGTATIFLMVYTLHFMCSTKSSTFNISTDIMFNTAYAAPGHLRKKQLRHSAQKHLPVYFAATQYEYKRFLCKEFIQFIAMH